MLRVLLASLVLSSASIAPALAGDGVLDVAAPFEIKGSDPSLSGDIFLKMDVAETLVNAGPDGTLTPGLAESWTVSEDGSTWRFKIRSGVVFHDGTPLDAAAAAGALAAARGKEGLLTRAPISAIEADGGDLVIRLEAPFAALPAFLAEYRSQILAPAAYGPDGMSTSVIGTGAFRVTRLEPPMRLEGERFPDYWGGPAKVERIAYAAVGRAETRALMAESGDADYAVNLDPASVTRLKAVDSVEVRSVSIPRSLLLKVNAGHPFLASLAARRALSLAIDREGLAAAVLRYPAAADQMFPPTMAGWNVPGLAPLGYDVEAAKALLAGEGWTPGADGILERDGRRFTLELLTYPDRPELPLVAAVLEQQFREIGVEIRINSANSSEIPAKHKSGALELALLARNFALVPDPIGTMLQDYAPSGDWGAMGWESARFTDLVKGLARGTGTAADRIEAATILNTELPVVPIAWYRQTAAISRKLTGAVVDPYERTLGLKSASLAE